MARVSITSPLQIEEHLDGSIDLILCMVLQTEFLPQIIKRT